MEKPSIYIPRIKGSGFTGDTGWTLDWQVGFEDPPIYGADGKKQFGFLGLFEGSAKERDALQQVLSDIQKEYPAPKSCQEAQTKIPELQSKLQQTKLDTQAGNARAYRWTNAFNIVLQDYVSYANNNCVSSTNTNSGPSANRDPILQTALPGVNDKPSDIAAAQQAAANPLTAAAGSNAASSTIAAKAKKIPMWAWIAGGVVLVGGIWYVAKHKK